MSKLSFKIKGMDCAEEVKSLKKALTPLFSEEQLLFDLINGKLSIKNTDTAIKPNQIIKRIKEKAAMEAILWENYVKQENTTWQKIMPMVLCLSSVFFLLVGLIFHAMHTDWVDALTGLHKTHAPLPIPLFSKLAYLFAIAAGGFYIFPKALTAIKQFKADMHLLMSIAVIGAICINQWLEATAVTTLFSIALLIESWSIGHARNAIKSLLALTPQTACCYDENDQLKETPIEAIDIGRRILVKPGERVPLDGTVINGEPFINQAPITGESLPVHKFAKDTVFAGTINGEQAFEFIVSKKATDSTLAGIITMIEEAQSRRAKSEQFVEKFAAIYTPIMIVFACLLASLPPLLLHQAFSPWFYEALVMLVIACPCALVISTPVSIVSALALAARHGVLIKGGQYLELPARLDAIAFDKTGTLTEGKPKVQSIHPLGDMDENTLLCLAASLEAQSTHPIGRAILEKAQVLNYQKATDVKMTTGRGTEGFIDGSYYWLGSHQWLHEKLPQQENDALHQQLSQYEDDGHTIVIMGNEEKLFGFITVADKLRDNSAKAIHHLRLVGIKHLTMLTGDNAGTASAIEKKIKLDSVKANLLPDDKFKQINLLNKQYAFIAMVGDGVNDAPAMASAQLGIAMGVAGSDTAIETADIALMSDDLMKLPWLILHAKRTLTIIRQNIAFALSVKALFIVLTLFGYTSLWMAIAADMGASLVVIFNGLRLIKDKKSLFA